MSPLRRRVAGIALLLLAPTVAACGFSEQTDQIYQPATGTNARTGQVDILNALIVSAKDGTGTFGGTLVSNSQTRSDQLVSVSGATGPVQVVVPAAGAVNLATAGKIRLSDSAIKAGDFVELTFQFASGQVTKLDVPVVPHSGDYAHVPVGPTATPTPSATPESPATTPTSSPTSSATASPTS